MVLWKLSSTTIRNPDRIHGFAQVANEFVGQEWKSGDQIQIDFQIALIQNKLYLQDETNDFDNVTLEQATEIARGPHDGWRWKYPHMRGRMSMSPLRNFGICYLDQNNLICFTQKGTQFINNEINNKDFFEYILLKYQSEDYNIIPVIGALQLIDKVNKLWEKKGNDPTGLSLDEFDLFVPSLIDHTMINSQAESVIEFRERTRKASTRTEQKQILHEFQGKFADEHLQADWDNDTPDVATKERIRKMKKRYSEYGDPILQFLRAAGWIHMRGGGFRVDLHPLRKIENEAIIRMSCVPVRHANAQAYAEYITNNEALELSWRTPKKLIEKYEFIFETICEQSETNNIPMKITLMQKDELEQQSHNELDSLIVNAQQELQRINTIKETQDVTHVDKINEIINHLKNPPSTKAYVELEYETTRGLMALDDGTIQPNYPLGDDGQPTNTAPGGAGDIECFYEKFNLLCEVTMLTNRIQQYQEGDPVTRHYVDFATKRKTGETYCLFIAPKMHEDTLNQFYYQNNRRGPKQTKIIPITITQFTEILELLVELKERNSSYRFSHENMTKLFDPILNSMDNFDDELNWRNNIQSIIDSWKEEILANS